MSINYIVSPLDSGKIASLLEVFAIFLGLLIAANLQAIVSLAARRRLYSRGTARLCDSTWNVGVVQGILNPRRLLRDVRAFLAFILAVGVICLEVLPFLETKSSKSCAFGDSSTWKIHKSSQKCFSPTPGIESLSSSFLSSKYMDSAIAKAQNIDLNLGIPIHTNVFEESIISGKAVQQLREGNYTELYTAPVVDVFDKIGEVSVHGGILVSRLKFRVPDTMYNNISRCRSEELDEEEPRTFPRKAEHLNYEKNGSTFITSSTGFVEISLCRADLVVRVCDFSGGRKYFATRVAGDALVFEVQCRNHVVFRENRRTDSTSLSSALFEIQTIDTSSIRRAVLASLIAQNSASTVPCRRYLATPKQCTHIGWVSLCAIMLLMGLFILTSFASIGLKIASRDGANFNGSPQMLAETLFNHLEGPERRESAVPGKRKKRDIILGPRLYEEDIHMSVMQGINDPDSYRLVWTRGPLPEGASPSAHVSGKAIVSHSEKGEYAEEFSICPH